MERFSLVVFGSSGYTGIYVVEEIFRYLFKYGPKFTWAVAGRNETKLRASLSTSLDYSGIRDYDVNSIEVIQADTSDYESLVKMAKRAKILVSCVGPYRSFGEPVVKACIESKTDYIDFCGEPQFLEEIQLRYYDIARERNLYILPSCGFDSLPCDVGVEFTKSKFPGTLDTVETFLSGSFKKGLKANSATWDCIIEGFHHSHELRPLRRKLFPEVFGNIRQFKTRYPIARKFLYRDGDGKLYIPFLGSDRSVVKRSQLHSYNFFKERPVQMEAYTYMPLKAVFQALISVALFMILVPFKFGRKLLHDYPRFFTWGLFLRGGPSREEVLSSSFEIILKGRGWKEKIADPLEQPTRPPDGEIVTRITGPNPGYPTAAISALFAGVTLLEERDKLPGSGGVLTPGVAFAKTSIVDRLNENGIKFEVISVS
ncbi:saccharopine dehydrogenase-like oxidoreductase [Tetranychus urticae]|uniref:Saccharopine dehydrogenase NADP binding domain-containing protein n=1 Tax=Tetranychus urticae TaxID=32264 RepID=T1K815_TETUR|nr:saccharopine dehydrogenase-like oxidoreductase [Tetranychus urticae]